jgi:23S rRNA (uracil1939-C5)-methyltransferase
MQVGQILEGQVEDLSRGGAGVLRVDGQVVFVPGTAPGDRIRVEVVAMEKRWAQGKLLEVLDASAHRVEPRCPVFGRCGGCQWQHLPYDFQWKTKLAGAQHALKRVGLQPLESEWFSFPAQTVWEYRNRVQLRGDKDSIGFFETGSRVRVPIQRCDIARPEVNERIPIVFREGLRRLDPEVGEYKVEIEVFPDGRVTESWNSRHAAGGFRQVHDEQNEVLQKAVGQFLTANAPFHPNDLLLDLYGGAGNLSLRLASHFKRVDCVDTGSPGGRPAGIPANFHFHRAPVGAWLQRHKRNENLLGGRIRVILDPPRVGLAEDAAKIVDVLKLWPVNEIVAVGCDADAWARDLARLSRAGWALKRAGALDLFPQTPHVECLALLVRES